MTNAERIADNVERIPGKTIYGLMRVVRRGMHSRLEFWYRDAYRAIELGLVRMDDSRRLWPVEEGTE